MVTFFRKRFSDITHPKKIDNCYLQLRVFWEIVFNYYLKLKNTINYCSLLVWRKLIPFFHSSHIQTLTECVMTEFTSAKYVTTSFCTLESDCTLRSITTGLLVCPTHEGWLKYLWRSRNYYILEWKINLVDDIITVHLVAIRFFLSLPFKPPPALDGKSSISIQHFRNFQLSRLQSERAGRELKLPLKWVNHVV